MEALKIGFISSEVHPYSKTGGLADVSAALPRHLTRAGFDVRVFTPLYGQIDTSRLDLRRVESLRHVPVRFGSRDIAFGVLTTAPAEGAPPLYFIDCPELYHRGGIYTRDPDEQIRFAMLSRATLESCQRLGWAPDILHLHDWHASLTPVYLKTLYAWDALFRATKTVLTIHNIGYQGLFPAGILPDLGLADHASLFHQEDLKAGLVNFLKTGLLHADLLTTVSETYAEEIQTDELGAGLQQILRARRRALVGIVNGVDYGEWNPANDPHIPFHYTPNGLANKGKNKKVLLQKLGMAETAEAPVIGIISRLAPQKGFELLFDVMPEQLAHRDIRLAVLGTGEPRIEEFFRRLQERFPRKACYFKGFSNELAHLIEAGSDMFLMPSRYEPCGLNQMYSMKYGTVPIVRRTGGLADTVKPYNPVTGEGTGFVFDHFTPDGLRWALGAAIDAFADGKAWKRLMANGMAQDYSWDVQGKRYEQIYLLLTGRA